MSAKFRCGLYTESRLAIGDEEQEATTGETLRIKTPHTKHSLRKALRWALLKAKPYKQYNTG
jgi:hypothetical protein